MTGRGVGAARPAHERELARPRTVAIVVIDGFGVGAMPDAGAIRTEDASADTLGALVQWAAREGTGLRIPNLLAAGLAQLRPDVVGECHHEPGQLMAGAVTARRSALGYPGADTFAGHQTMMGADMSHVVLARVADRLEDVRDALVAAGHHVALFQGKEPLLVVDGRALVHDNLEADPALNWNVSARLDEMDWPDILTIAQDVRRVAPVARVIAVGGYSDRPLADSVRRGPGNTIGLDTPASGFYRLGGLRVQHLGVDIDHHRQLPQLAANSGLPVTLVGKAADILVAEGSDVVATPGVETDAVLEQTMAGIKRGGLVVANVQQTDLAGHQQDPGRFVDLVEQVDAALPAFVGAMTEGDLLVVTGDHGNDPSIGHAFHTREYVPVLAVHAGSGARSLGGVATGAVSLSPEFDTLADVGASAAAALGLDPGRLECGRAFEL